MAKNFVHEGTAVEYTAGADISSGDVVAMGDSIGIALTDIANGATGAVAIEGVFTVAKAAGTAWNCGDKLDWDASASAFAKGITEATGDISDCAIAFGDAETAATTATVKLTNPGAVN